MLNYIWLFLIVAGILIAAGSDWHDISVNTYHNGELIPAAIVTAGGSNGRIQCRVELPGYNTDGSTGSVPVPVAGEMIPETPDSGIILLRPQGELPGIWKTVMKTGNQGIVQARYSLHHAYGTSADTPGARVSAGIRFDPVRYVRMNAVTNDGIVNSAKTAVELAIGLIGLMALWLGVMKIAEQAGLIATVARFLRPLTVRLFPGVPPEHPAMGAMIMNISANMLGLSNAATPLGLKAMEELNRLNPRAGTATDAMCTFLVINTSNVQLIPATVIAIRAAAGSAHPTEILGPVIVATAVALTVGLIVVKLLARLPVFRNQIAVPASGTPREGVSS